MTKIYDLTTFKEQKMPIMYIYSGPMVYMDYAPDPSYCLVIIKLEFTKGGDSLARVCSGITITTGIASWFRIYGSDYVSQGTIGSADSDIIFANPSLIKGTITSITQLTIGYDMRKKIEDLPIGSWEKANIPCPPAAKGSAEEVLAETNHEADHLVRDRYVVKYGNKRPTDNS